MLKKSQIKFSACLTTLLLFALTPIITLAQVRVIALDDNPRMAFLTTETSTGFNTQGSFIIENPQAHTVTVELTTVDGARTSDGTFSTKQPTETQDSLGSWIQLSTKTVSINSSSSITINFTLNAPLTTDSGIHHGAIIATAKARLKRGETNPPPDHKTVLPIFIKIPGEEIIKTSYDSFAYSTDKNQIYYNYQITNNGNTIIMAQPTLESKLFGIFTKQTSLAEKKLYPGDSINFFTNLRDKPLPGVYVANGIISFFNYDIFEDTITPLSTEEKSFTIHHKIHNFLLIPIILLFLFTFHLFKKIQIKRSYLKGKPYTPKPGETIQTIAKKFHLNWQKLAKINHLPPPFTVNITSSIIIPKRKFKKYADPNPPAAPNQQTQISTAAKITSAITTLLLTSILLFSYSNTVQSQQTEATLEVKSGAIFIDPPETINLDKWFIPTENTGSVHVYKTLSPEIAPNLLYISDYDTGGINYKVSVSTSNHTNMETPHSIIPFTNFSLVTLAIDTQNNVDILAGTQDLTDITLPAACSWNATSGTLKENCDILLTQRTFIGEGQFIPSDPTTPINEQETIMNVTDSSIYNQGDILKMENELALVTEIKSPTQIEIIRGITGTVSQPQHAAANIKNLGSYSLEQDLFVAPETVNRASIYSMGFGIRALLEPTLNLHPGNYGGTITFTLYTCATPTCL